MSANMPALAQQAVERAVNEQLRAIRVALRNSGDSGTIGTVNHTRVVRATTTSDSDVRGWTITFNVVESATPAGLSPNATDDVTAA